MSARIISLISFLLFASMAWGQQQSPQNGHDMDMSAHGMSNMEMKDMPMDTEKDTDKESDASAHAMHSMEEHMDMGPHMKMTALRPAKPGDAARARQWVEASRQASEEYVTYHAPLPYCTTILHPQLPQ